MTSSVPRTAMSLISSLPARKTTRRNSGASRVVEVDVGAVYADQRLHAALDQVLAGLGQHRDRDVVGDPVAPRSAGGRRRSRSRWPTGSRPRSPCSPSDTSRSNIVILRAGRHRVDQRLVAVAQVGGEPARRLGDGGVGPGAVGQVDRRERPGSARTACRWAAAVRSRAGVLVRHGSSLVGVGVGAGAQHDTPQRGGPAGSGPRCGSEGGGWAHHDPSTITRRGGPAHRSPMPDTMQE